MWKAALCPILATNENQQRLVDALFAECLARAEAIHEQLPEAPEPPPAPEARAAKRWGRLAIASALLLAVLLGLGIRMWIESRRPAAPGDLKRYFSVAPGATLNVCADSLDLARDGGVVSAAFAAGGDTLGTPLGAYRLLPGGCLRAHAGDSLGQDSLRVLLRNTSGQTVALDYFPTIRRAPSTVHRPPSTVTYRFYEREVPEPADIRGLAIDVPKGWEAEFLRYLLWLKGLFLLLLGLLLYALLRHRARRRQKLVAETQHGDRPPYTWNISIRDLETPDPGEGFPLVLNRLRRRTGDDWLELDLRATVQATVAQAGRIDFRFQQQTKPPEYLLLIDRHDAADHRARLFDELYQRFRANDVLIERFFYDGDPRLCFNEQYPGGLQLNELYHQYPESRLLLIGAGHTLLNPLNLKLTRWAEALARWRQRSLFSPRPPGEWGRREQVLGELLPVLPASLRAFWYAVEQFDAGEDADFGRWGDAVTDAPPAPVEPDPQNLIASLRRHYSDDLLQWIAACAVYPSLHYELTIYLWQVLFPGARLSLTNAGQGETAGATLSALTALPWFTKGSIPDPARAELLHWFEQNHPEQHRRVRLALAEQLALPHNQPPRDSAAWDQYRMSAALNEWRFTDDRKKKKALEREIEELLKYTEADFTVIHYLNKPKNPLQFEVPERWKKILYRAGRPGLGLQDFWRDLFGWALWIWVAAAAGLGWYQPKTEECNGEQVRFEYAGENLTLCLKSLEDYALYLEYLARSENAAFFNAPQAFDSLINEAETIISAGRGKIKGMTGAIGPAWRPIQHPAFKSFLQNICLLAYNRGVPYYQLADSLRQTTPAPHPADYAAQKDSACAWFSRAYTLYNNDTLLRDAAAWCARPDTFDRKTPSEASARQQTTRIPVITGEAGAAEDDLAAGLPPGPCTDEQVLRAWAQLENQYQRRSDLIPNLVNTVKRSANFERITLEKVIVARASASQVKIGNLTPEAIRRFEQAQQGLSLALAHLLAVAENYPDLQVTQNFIGLRLQLEVTENRIAVERRNFKQAVADYLARTGTATAPAPATAPATATATATPRPTMISIPAGSFDMGDVLGDNEFNDEKPVHRVSLSAFQLAATELTFEEYDRFCEATGRDKPDDEGWGRGKRPVINVSWYDAVDYCNWLSEQHGYKPAYTRNGNEVTCDWNANGYRLPTEAEWEYAAREGGKNVRFGNGKDVADPMEINFDASVVIKKTYSLTGEYRQQTVLTGSLNSPNKLGLHDMSGNVYEWCWDWFGDYPSAAQTDPHGPDSGVNRVRRGGSEGVGSQIVRAALRGVIEPDFKSANGGFRLARTL